jgi:hypothetical protein
MFEFAKFNSIAAISLDIKLNSRRLNEIMKANLANYSLFFIPKFLFLKLIKFHLHFLDYFALLSNNLLNLLIFKQHFMITKKEKPFLNIYNSL